MVTVDELRAAFPVLDMVDLQRRPKTTVMGHAWASPLTLQPLLLRAAFLEGRACLAEAFVPRHTLSGVVSRAVPSLSRALVSPPGGSFVIYQLS